MVNMMYTVDLAMQYDMCTMNNECYSCHLGMHVHICGGGCTMWWYYIYVCNAQCTYNAHCVYTRQYVLHLLGIATYLYQAPQLPALSLCGVD